MGVNLGGRPIHFLHNGHFPHARKRGLDFFEKVAPGNSGYGLIPATIRSFRPDGILIVTMPCTTRLHQIIAEHPGLTIVDVYADVMHLARPGAVPESARILSGENVAAFEWWDSDPSRAETLRMCCKTASVVTTPFPWLHGPLKKINPSVMLLPDYNEDDPKAFMRDFIQVVLSAVED